MNMPLKLTYALLFFFAAMLKISPVFAQPSVAHDTAYENLLKIIAKFPDSSEMIVRSVTVKGNKTIANV